MLVIGELGLAIFVAPDSTYAAGKGKKSETVTEEETKKEEAASEEETSQESQEESKDSKDKKEDDNKVEGKKDDTKEEKEEAASEEETSQESQGSEEESKDSKDKEENEEKVEGKKEESKEEKEETKEETKEEENKEESPEKEPTPLNPEEVDANSEDNPLNPKEGEEEDEKAEEEQQVDAYVPLLEYFDERFGTPLLYPLPYEVPITEEFGSVDYLHPTGHMGLDFGAAMGTPILAGEAGTVIKAEYYGGYGYCVFIDHGNSTETRYGHMSEINVKEGDKVKRGQQIGRVGSTGHSTGPHLHFEVIFRGLFASPRLYIGLPAYIPTTKEIEVDGIKIRVDTDYGTFTEDWQLDVTRSSEGIENQATWAIEGIRDEVNKHVKTYAFNIKVLDMDGNEMQPEVENALRISFSIPENLDQNITFGAYHLVDNPKKVIHKPSEEKQAAEHRVEICNLVPMDDGGEKSNKHDGVFNAESLELVNSGEPGQENMTVRASSLSYFAVEYTYAAKQFVMKDDNKASLEDILSKVGLTGEVTKVEVEEHAPFGILEEEGKKYVLAYEVFEEGHVLKVTINGIEYEIAIVNRCEPKSEDNPSKSLTELS